MYLRKPGASSGNAQQQRAVADRVFAAMLRRPENLVVHRRQQHRRGKRLLRLP